MLYLRFRCLTSYVISTYTRISDQYITSNFSINVFSFISDQDKNVTSFVAWSIQSNFFLEISANQGNFAESFFRIAVHLTFSYLIPYKILHLYLPEMSVRMTYPIHPRKTRNTPSCTSMYPKSMIMITFIYPRLWWWQYRPSNNPAA